MQKKTPLWTKLLVCILMLAISGCRACNRSTKIPEKDQDHAFATPNIRVAWTNDAQTSFRITLLRNNNKHINVNHKIRVSMAKNLSEAKKVTLNKKATSYEASLEHYFEDAIWACCTKQQNNHLDTDGNIELYINFQVSKNTPTKSYIFIHLINEAGEIIPDTEHILQRGHT